VQRTNKKLKELVVVSPDLGGAKRAREFANRLGGLEVAVIQKTRPRPNVSAIVKVIGEVDGKDCLILDDILDTGGTIVNASIALKESGASRVLVCCVHPLLSDNALERIADSPIDEVVVTDTIPLRTDHTEKLTVVSVSALLSEAMKRIHENRSVSSLFK
jgi:ribose-phosphate pyrophosphokinase